MDIEEKVDGFYYEDEEGDYIGPFPSYQQAHVVYEAALRWQCRDNQKDLRKLKDDD